MTSPICLMLRKPMTARPGEPKERPGRTCHPTAEAKRAQGKQDYGRQVVESLAEGMMLGDAGVINDGDGDQASATSSSTPSTSLSRCRGKSRLSLPIVNKDVEGTRVSIYNERTCRPSSHCSA